MSVLTVELAQSLFSNQKLGRGWRSRAQKLGIDVTSCTSQDIWDAANPDKILCPECLIRDRAVKQTNLGRTETCGSAECAQKSKQRKIEMTSMERYGTRIPMMAKSVKEKQATTFKLKYGTHPTKTEATQLKRKMSNLKLYGCHTPAMGTNKKTSSVETYKQNRKSNYIANIWPSRKQSIENNLNISALTDWIGAKEPIQWKHNQCGYEWEAAIPDGGLPWCPRCGLSKEQSGLETFISEIYNGRIERNVRCVIKPYELDIWIPDLKVAIELNGWFWHQDGKSTPMVKKTEMCSELGIRLIHIMDWEWNSSRDIVKSHLQHLLGLTNEKIDARKCVVRRLTSAEAESFFMTNHISGHVASSFYFGAIYNGEIIAAMSLAKPRWSKKFDLEIIRWATKLNTTVRGGFSKILKRAIEEIKPKSIVSFCDRRFGDGKVYAANGFMLEENTKPNYWWIKGSQRLSRYQTQKHMLDKLLKDFDPMLSESDNMLKNGWTKVSDSGNGRWVLKLGE